MNTGINQREERIVLVFILLVALLLSLYNNNFPLGYHGDEHKKVFFIEENEQDFQHPILMLQVVRALLFFTDFSNYQDIVLLGRVSTAIFETLIVLFSYLIFRDISSKKWALLTSLSIAFSPIMVIHAHYLKEDIILTCFSLLSVFALIKFIQNSNTLFNFFLGFSAGLAISSHYKGILILLIIMMVPLFIHIEDRRQYYKKYLLTLVIAGLTFGLINYPLFLEPTNFIKGSSFSLDHSLKGHTLKISPITFLGGFHLLYSVVPGLTLLLTLLALGGLTLLILNWKNVDWREKILFFYIMIFYFVVELSPTKPHPDFMRYIIPIIPMMLYFAYKMIYAINLGLRPTKFRFITSFLILVTLALPLYDSVHLVYYLNKDTRVQTKKILIEIFQKTESDSEIKVIMENYSCGLPIPANIDKLVNFAGKLDIAQEKRKGTTYIVVSSFAYDRFFFGSKLDHQNEDIYNYYRIYQELFKHPFIEIAPAYKTFAFSNPTLRIIDLR